MPEILSTENLSRFILTNDYIRADNTVRWNAFIPQNDETSVFRTSGISESEIWEIGNHDVAANVQKPLLGRADIITLSVTEKGLSIIPQEPPTKHAIIVGWPERKEEKRAVAMLLARDAILHKKDIL